MMESATGNETIQPLSRSALTKLTSGKRVNILIRTVTNKFIAVEGPKEITYSSRGHKQIIQWIYQWMAAGESDGYPKIKLDNLSVEGYCNLIWHASYMRYAGLETRVYGGIRARIDNTLLPGKEAVRKLYATVPELAETCIPNIVNFMLKPLETDYQAYMELAEEDQRFKKALDAAIPANQRIANAKWQLSVPQKSIHARSFKGTQVERRCYACQGKGHIARDCVNVHPNRPRARNRAVGPQSCMPAVS